MNIYKISYNAWKQTPATKEEEAYFKAWQKIRKWVWDNVKADFEEPIEIKLPFNTYHKTKFGVTSDKKAYILRGSHGQGYDNYVDWPDGSYGKYSFGTLDTEKEPERLSSITMAMIKEVVDEWYDLKKQLQRRLNDLDDLYSFTA